MTSYDLAIVGGGPAGYAAALRARELGSSVVLIEAQHVGGHCVHFSCIPSTIMLDSARRALEAQELSLAGVFADPGLPNFGRAAARKSVLVHNLAQGIAALLKSRRVTVLDGRASFTSATTLDVQLLDGGSESIEARAVILATGARYEPTDLSGIPANDQLSPDEALALPEAPGSVLVVGGGPAGLGFAWEYASLFGIFGDRVVLLEPNDSPLADFDETVVEVLLESLKQVGVEVHIGASITQAARSGDTWKIDHTSSAGDASIEVGAVLRPDARVPVSDVPGLSALGVVDSAGFVSVDSRGATNAPGLFAAGDVTGSPMLSSVAEVQGRVAAENATGGDVRANLSIVPQVLHTEPEVAAVGLTEAQARAEGYEVKLGMANLAGNGRSAALGRREGLVKLVADGESGELLGMHIAAPFASEAIAQGVLALQLGATLDDLGSAMHWHPTIAEAISAAARSAR
jgi:dihydrolipoamide dehydrogenase